jgi:hypothetical protein
MAGSDDVDTKTVTLKDTDLEVIGSIEDVPTIYIDGMQGLITAGGIVKIGLYQYVQKREEMGHPPSAENIKKLITGRLVMPEHVARDVAAWLTRHILKPGDANGPKPGT